MVSHSGMLFGVPIVIIFLFKHGMDHLPGGREIITSELDKLGKITREEILVLIVFLFAAFMWITRGFIWSNWSVTEMLTDGAIAMMASVILFLLPTKRKSKRILDWSVARDLPMGRTAALRRRSRTGSSDCGDGGRPMAR